MKGITIKTLLLERGIQQKDIADKLGVSKQVLSAALVTDDVRSSLIEGVAAVLGMQVSELYGELRGPSVSANNGGTVVTGNYLNTQIDKFLDLLKEKDVQTARFQKEIDTLLDIIKEIKG